MAARAVAGGLTDLAADGAPWAAIRFLLRIVAYWITPQAMRPPPPPSGAG